MSTNLGDLLRARGFRASSPPPNPEPEATADALRFAPKVVLRETRKGRGGKTVTVVDGVLGGRDALAKELRKRLGAGVRVEGEQIVVQGRMSTRIAAFLERRGARKIVVG